MIVRYTRQAGYDLSTILNYIEERSLKGSKSVKQMIRRTVKNIESNPNIGHEIGRDAVRVISIGKYPYLVYWTVESDEIWIIHIRHGMREQWKTPRY